MKTRNSCQNFTLYANLIMQFSIGEAAVNTPLFKFQRLSFPVRINNIQRQISKNKNASIIVKHLIKAI